MQSAIIKLMDNWAKGLGDSLTLGFELVLPTVLGALLGYYIDQRFAWPDVAMIIGVFVGAALGFLNVVRKYIFDANQKEKR